MSAESGFPISLDVQRRLCVIIGGEDEAADKAQRLADAEGLVVVVNPTLNVTLRKMTSTGKVIHRGRRFRSSDTHDACLVCNTLRDDSDLAKSLFELAKDQKFLVWSIDQPELSTFMMPAVVNRGQLRLAISTSQASPALAGTLRQQTEQLFDDEFVDFLEWLGRQRKELQQSEPNSVKRQERLKELVQGFQVSGKIEYPSSWKTQKQRLSTTIEKES